MAAQDRTIIIITMIYYFNCIIQEMQIKVLYDTEITRHQVLQ